ncbi:MAG: Thermophilic serine proteinase [Anaerolineales bacterium]|nr:Thermophilic serine proteinase [Anaerolineales bacterium]
MKLDFRLQPVLIRLLPFLLLATTVSSARATPARPLAQPDDPRFPDQWNLYDPTAGGQPIRPDINAATAWDVTTGTPDTVIAILDSGIDLEHPDLASKIWLNEDEVPDNGTDDDDNGKVDDVNGWDFVAQDNEPQDEDGWGTFIAGIAGGATNNGVGIAGIAWNTPLMPVRVLTRDSMGQATARLDDIIAGIRYAVDNGARIIHLGFYVEEENLTVEQRAALEAAINEAYEAGALLVAPAGDHGLAGNPTVYPAAFPSVMGVTATDRAKERLTAAGHGSFVEIAAPGVALEGPLPDNRYSEGAAEGTEFAAPHISGTAALIWAVNPSLRPEQVRDFMRDTADDLGAVGYDEVYGFGLLNAALAVLTTPHMLHISPHELHFQVDEFGAINPPTHKIVNPNTGGLTWRATTQSRWLVIEGLTETTPSSVTVSVDLSKIPHCGEYAGSIVVESNQRNSMDGEQTIDVTLEFATGACAQVHLPLVRR